MKQSKIITPFRSFVREAIEHIPGLIDVLGAPFYGPKASGKKDSYKTFFSPKTNFHREQLPLPPVVYRHGYMRNEGIEFPGKALKRWTDSRGEWFKVQLDLATERGKNLWRAAQAKRLYSSTGVVPASYFIDDETGEIVSWLIGELTLIDVDLLNGVVPSNFYATAQPAGVRDGGTFTFGIETNPPGRPGLEAIEAQQGVVILQQGTSMDEFINELRTLLAQLINLVDSYAAASNPEASAPPEEGMEREASEDTTEEDAADETTRMDGEDPTDEPDMGARMATKALVRTQAIGARQLAQQLQQANARIQQLEETGWFDSLVRDGFATEAERAEISEQLNGFTGSSRVSARDLILKSRKAAKTLTPQHALVRQQGPSNGVRVLAQPKTTTPAEEGINPDAEAYLARMKHYAGIK